MNIQNPQVTSHFIHIGPTECSDLHGFTSHPLIVKAFGNKKFITLLDGQKTPGWRIALVFSGSFSNLLTMKANDLKRVKETHISVFTSSVQPTIEPSFIFSQNFFISFLLEIILSSFWQILHSQFTYYYLSSVLFFFLSVP